jgi:tight adherence protein C
MGIAPLDRFVGVVTQALAFGSSLAATLEQQAQAIRDEQRAQMEEEIEQVPVRMLIPLGTLIVPAMLLAILGPLLGASLQLG